MTSPQKLNRVPETTRLEVTGGACTLYFGAPQFAGRPTAAFGAFECEDEVSGRRLLTQAVAIARRNGSTALLGPMDGDTWHQYRFVTEADETPPFFLEPQNPQFYPRVLEGAGMTPVADYASAIDHRMVSRSLSLGSRGVRIRSWRRDAPEHELAAIHELALRAFTGRSFYRPIDFEAFGDLYRPLLPMIDPDLVLFAENDQRQTLGFLFGTPDFIATEDQTAPDGHRLIIKTYASLQPGIGALLVDHFYRVARARNAGAVIHALFEATNASARHSARIGAKIFRRYALWGMRISS